MISDFLILYIYCAVAIVRIYELRASEVQKAAEGAQYMLVSANSVLMKLSSSFNSDRVFPFLSQPLEFRMEAVHY